MAEVPLLKQLYWKYQDRGLNFVGVSLDQDRTAAERLIKQKDIFWPQVCDGKADEGRIPKLYNVSGTPVLFVIDRAGNIAARLNSAKQLDQQLFEVVAGDAIPRRTQRDTWQRPVRVMEDLHIRSGSSVADIGAGGGYFTFRLAWRVGAEGLVYSQDLDENALKRIRERARSEKLTQIRTIQGTQDDPKLPSSMLDSVLIVDAFHEFANIDGMVAGIARALKPSGRVGIIDSTAPLGLRSEDYIERHYLPQEILIDDMKRGGFRLVSFDTDFAGPPGERRYYFAVFSK